MSFLTRENIVGSGMLRHECDFHEAMNLKMIFPITADVNYCGVSLCVVFLTFVLLLINSYIQINIHSFIIVVKYILEEKNVIVYVHYPNNILNGNVALLNHVNMKYLVDGMVVQLDFGNRLILNKIVYHQ